MVFNYLYDANILIISKSTKKIKKNVETKIAVLVSLSCNMSNRALQHVFSKIAGAKIGNNSETAKHLYTFFHITDCVCFNYKLPLPSFKR